MKAKVKDSEEEERTLEEATPASEKQSNAVVVRINVKLLVGIVIVLAIGAGLFFAKSLFVVAIVNGAPITRLAVIKELETRSGKQALDAMITEKLVDDELKKKNITASDEEVTTEIQKLEAQIAQQGGTLQAILDQQGLSREELSEQITSQKKLEKLFLPGVTVSEEDVAAYVKETQITIPEGDEGAQLKAQVTEQLRRKKLSDAIQTWIADLKSAASITYFKAY